jgi:hypothetical protein
MTTVNERTVDGELAAIDAAYAGRLAHWEWVHDAEHVADTLGISTSAAGRVLGKLHEHVAEAGGPVTDAGSARLRAELDSHDVLAAALPGDVALDASPHAVRERLAAIAAAGTRRRTAGQAPESIATEVPW